MAIGDDLLIERLTNRESQLSQQSDTLDVKASILLVVVTFLAGQSADLLSKHPHGWIHWEQMTSIVLQVIAGVLLALQLRIRTYSAETSEKYPQWRDELSQHYRGSETSILDQMKRVIIEAYTTRLSEANRYNDRKASLVNKTFWITLLSLACNLAALAPLLVS
jgi:hypothetical protein